MNKEPRILIVEDSEDDAQLLLRALRAGGILAPVCKRVDTAEGMRAALDAQPWDIVLSDYNMPRFDALAALEIARRKDADLPFILISGTIGEEVAVAAMRAGADDYFVKGHLGRLIAAIERELREAVERRARKRVEAELRESEAIYRTLVDQASDSILLLERPSEGRPDGIPIICDANAAALRLHGYSREELLGRPISILDADATESLIMERTSRLQAGKNAVFEAKHRRKDGSVFDLEVSVKEVTIGGKRLLLDISRDITKRKKAEESVREAYEVKELINSMLHHSLAPLPLKEKLAGHLAGLLSIPWFAMSPQGAIFLAAGRTLTLTVQQGLPPALLVSCAKIPFGKCLCGRAAESGQSVAAARPGREHEFLYKGITPHGHYCSPIIAAGAVLGVLTFYLKDGTVITDMKKDFIKAVTDILAADILHARVEEQFTQAQKIEAVGLLAGGVAHDFNNILTAIISYAEFIRRELPPGDPKLADVHEILTAADRAAALTQQLLAFGRRQIMAPRVVDLNKIAGGMVKMLNRLIGEDIKLTTKLVSAPCLALVDPGQIEQVIMNLVINARDAMPKGGTISLETEILPPDEGAHPDMPRTQLICLSVRDTGCGMTAEVKGRIFEPFFTTKEPGKGTGLGLSTVFGIIKQSGGEITVESEPDKGTRFLVYLPLVDACLKGKDKDKAKAKAALLKGPETVLFVEDEESLRRLGVRILASGGYTWLTAANGAEALRVLERHGKPVDLLLTDVVMPGMDGRELALEMTRRKLVKRVLYMSGYTDDAIVKHGVLEPGIAFIYKPFTVDAVLSKLREVLDAPADQARA